MAPAPSNAIWDNDGTYAISARQVQLVRDAGALRQLPLYLHASGIARASTGDLAGAASNMAEADSAAAATGSARLPWTALRLRVLQGREAEVIAAIASAIEQAAAGVQRFWRSTRAGRRRPVQRPWPLRGGGSVSEARHLERLRVLGIRVRASRACRGRRSHKTPHAHATPSSGSRKRRNRPPTTSRSESRPAARRY